MQVEVKKLFYQSFGGINFIDADIRGIGFNTLVSEHLGCRSLLATYSYSDLLKHIFYSKAIGGDVLDDLNTLKKQVQDHPSLRIASPDTIEYAFQELVQPIQKKATATGKEHHINEHAGFNKLFVSLCAKTGLLSRSKNYCMDYDGHTVENTKNDNAFTYKKTEGYYPVMCSINKLPVYLQNRKGNTPESYNNLQAIVAAYEQCKAQNICIDKFRADACCYEKETIQYLEKENITYYIRAEKNEHLRIALEDENEWQPVVLNHVKIEVCSVNEPLFGANKDRRIVAYRKKLNNEQATIFDRNGYRYHSIVTSDTVSTPLEVIEFYNQRGCEGEHHFKELDYDFSWNKLPFHTFALNTIYLYATAISYILFQFIKQKYAGILSFVNTSMRLKNFTLHFVALTAKWVKTGRQWVLKIFTTKDYSPVFQT